MPIPIVNGNTNKDAKDLSQAVERMLALQAKLPQTSSDRELETLRRQISSTDYRIDQLVYKLYGLTEAEVSLVETA